MYDINPKNATKFNGVRILAEHYDIPLSDIVSFGDDFNDVEMLRECGIGVAMSNAISECKTVADYICDDCDNDGVAKWLEDRIVLRARIINE